MTTDGLYLEKGTSADEILPGTIFNDHVLGFAGHDTLSGAAGNDVIEGGAGNDTLIGGTGADTMIGGADNDTYHVDNAGDVVTENVNEGADVVNASVSYTLANNVENLTLTGSANINGTGNTLSNTLTGNSGNNILDGGIGVDTMVGATGNDTYVVDNAGDVVTENVNGGADTVNASIAFSLAALTNIENLTLTGSANINGTGNTLSNSLTGNSGNNILDGGAGTDVMAGGAGNDTYHVDSSFDSVVENGNEGTDTVLASASFALSSNVENITLQGTGDIAAYGNGLANILTGNSGNNLLDGGGDADFMYGLAGNDGYMVDSSFDQIFENAGEGDFDTVYASVSYALGANIENMFLQGTGNFQAIGNAQSNTITGNDGDNLMDGGGGIDGLIGGKGNDGYMIDNPFDQIVENADEGDFDTVYTSVDYQLGANLENVFMQGTASLAVYGNDLSNVITGNDGDNLLNGGLGIDGLIGGKGGDTYVIDNSFDQIVEYANEGTDAVYANVSYQLGENLETLFLSDSAIQGYGNSGVNSIVGTAGNNGIDGRGGADVLTGNGGLDTFIFNMGEMNGDTIMDFDGLDAGSGDQLMFVGFGAGASLQQINANVWQIDYNGGTSHEQFTLANSAAIHASDFVFV